MAPVLASADIVGSYVPFLVLRAWCVGFAIYAIRLASQAGGFRKLWQGPFFLMVVTFSFVWGLETQHWAIIDWACAVAVLVSMPFLRTIPASHPAL
jgi:hypothetical protein